MTPPLISAAPGRPAASGEGNIGGRNRVQRPPSCFKRVEASGCSCARRLAVVCSSASLNNQPAEKCQDPLEVTSLLRRRVCFLVNAPHTPLPLWREELRRITKRGKVLLHFQFAGLNVEPSDVELLARDFSPSDLWSHFQQRLQRKKIHRQEVTCSRCHLSALQTANRKSARFSHFLLSCF